VRRSNLATVVNLLIAIGVTLRTRRQRARRRTEARALMLRMTINTADTRRFMRLDHGRCERLSTMTRSTSPFHVSGERVTVSTRTGVWRSRNRRQRAELGRRVRVRDRPGRECTRIPVSSRNRNQPNDD